MNLQVSTLAFAALAAVATGALAPDTASAGIASKWSSQTSSAGKFGGYGGSGAPIKVSSHVPGSAASKVGTWNPGQTGSTMKPGPTGSTMKPGSTGSTWKPGQTGKIECFHAPCNTGSTWKPGHDSDWHPGKMGGYDSGSKWRPWHRPWTGYGGGYGVFPIPTETYETPVPSYVSAPVQPYVQAPVASYVSAPVQRYAQPVAGPCTCLTKSYMQDGSVVFADNCTKEQAMAGPAQGQSASVQ
jgi:hypothetical protein